MRRSPPVVSRSWTTTAKRFSAVRCATDASSRRTAAPHGVAAVVLGAAFVVAVVMD
jgi:hypothetical protein